MFRKNKKKQPIHLPTGQAQVTRYLETAIRVTQETLWHGGSMIENPDNELTVTEILDVGPEIECGNAGLPTDIVGWVRREATYRLAVAYAREHDCHIERGNDTVISETIDRLSRQPVQIQAGFLNAAALLP